MLPAPDLIYHSAQSEYAKGREKVKEQVEAGINIKAKEACIILAHYGKSVKKCRDKAASTPGFNFILTLKASSSH